MFEVRFLPMTVSKPTTVVKKLACLSFVLARVQHTLLPHGVREEIGRSSAKARAAHAGL